MAVIVFEDVAQVIAEEFGDAPSFGPDCIVIEQIPRGKRVVHAVGDYKIREVTLLGLDEYRYEQAIFCGMIEPVGVE